MAKFAAVGGEVILAWREVNALDSKHEEGL